MKNLDYATNKIKKLVCRLFGHKLVPHVKYKEKNGQIVSAKTKYYTCSRCGAKVTVTEKKQKY